MTAVGDQRFDGNVGIKRDPGTAYQLMATDENNGSAGVGIANTSTGVSARAELIARNDSSIGYETGVYGTGVTGSAWGEVLANAIYFWDKNAVSKMFIGMRAASPMFLITGDAKRVTIQGDGKVLISQELEVAEGIGEFGTTPPSSQPVAIADVPTSGSATAAANATAINAILAVLRDRGTIAT